MTLDQILDSTSALMLGGGITLAGLIASIVLTLRKVKNSAMITSQLVLILNALANIIRDRKDTIAELKDFGKLIAALRALLDVISSIEPVVVNETDADAIEKAKEVSKDIVLTAPEEQHINNVSDKTDPLKDDLHA